MGGSGSVDEIGLLYATVNSTWTRRIALRGKFREALRNDPRIQVSPQEFSGQVRRVFEAERQIALPQKKKRSILPFVLVIGGGAAASVGVAAARGGDPPPDTTTTTAPTTMTAPGGPGPTTTTTTTPTTTTTMPPCSYALAPDRTFAPLTEGATLAGPGRIVFQLSREPGERVAFVFRSAR
jgi:hypothetical protein